MSEHLSKPDVYVHVPKAAGTSLYSALVDRHGLTDTYTYDDRSDKLYRADRRLIRRESPQFVAIEGLIKAVPPAIIRTGMRLWELRATSEDKAFERASAIIGHFAVDRFDDVAGAERARYATVVREPLDRMISHYRFLQQQRGYDSRLRGWMRGQNPDLSFSDFALDPSVHNFQTRYTGADPKRYELLGTVERFPAFLTAAGLVEADDATVPYHNKTTWTGRPSEPLLNDPGFQRDFQVTHAADYEFYQAALDRQLVL